MTIGCLRLETGNSSQVYRSEDLFPLGEVVIGYLTVSWLMTQTVALVSTCIGKDFQSSNIWTEIGLLLRWRVTNINCINGKQAFRLLLLLRLTSWCIWETISLLGLGWLDFLQLRLLMWSSDFLLFTTAFRFANFGNVTFLLTEVTAILFKTTVTWLTLPSTTHLSHRRSRCTVSRGFMCE